MRPIQDLWLGLRVALRDGQVRGLMALTFSLIAGAAFFYSWAEGWGLLDAFYFSVITISTIGYGDLVPQTVPGKLFTMGYVLVGLGLFVASASAIADAIISSRRGGRGKRGQQ
ncbi:potassium channel family protein [Paracoccus methylarcula]|uniref:Two pore domain potassium channel family protein n=1 Tax=Paracoccus methylarcula TaxID=72022 RepID=A0A422R1N4_9RHOB|nr:potassium channel family protein [Paracoccus methylarcula]RNF36091.1 two pore domain potassium channel family protein [Paracoccus methylarcula]